MYTDYIGKQIKRHSVVCFADRNCENGSLTQGLVISFGPLGAVVDTGVNGLVLVSPNRCVVIPKKRKPRSNKKNGPI